MTKAKKQLTSAPNTAPIPQLPKPTIGEYLSQRLKGLEAGAVQLSQDLHATNGAIQECKNTIANLSNLSTTQKD
jgi:hypothetical protein